LLSNQIKINMILIGFVGPWQIVIVVVLIVLLFGGKKIPELMKGLGKGISEFKKGAKEGEEELKKEDDK
jgi:sec-independent protein translocase protein TatA